MVTEGRPLPQCFRNWNHVLASCQAFSENMHQWLRRCRKAPAKDMGHTS